MENVKILVECNVHSKQHYLLTAYTEHKGQLYYYEERIDLQVYEPLKIETAAKFGLKARQALENMIND